MSRLRRLAVTLSVATCAAHADGVTAAEPNWPSRPIRLILPATPGSSTDILGRLVGKWLESDLKATVPVINMPGATGAIGVGRMVQNGADAHSIAVMTGDTLALATNADSTFKFADVVPLGVMIRQP